MKFRLTQTHYSDHFYYEKERPYDKFAIIERKDILQKLKLYKELGFKYNINYTERLADDVIIIREEYKVDKSQLPTIDINSLGELLDFYKGIGHSIILSQNTLEYCQSGKEECGIDFDDNDLLPTLEIYNDYHS